MTKQVYNFLDHRLKSEVSYEVTVCDDYKPENLLLAIPAPFKAYNVVKPPIELKFKFLCKVNILFIKIYGQVDSLKSIAFEISNKDTGRLAFGTCDSLNEVGVCFYQGNVPNGCEGLNKSTFFRSIRPINEFVLKIVRTKKCPPVLRRIEVWGTVARDCTVPELQLIECLWNQKAEGTAVIEEPQKVFKEKIETLEKDPGFQIPEEFLDEITWELMCIPFTLPSGKVVDERTIELHNRTEAEYGRLPSDPFTGQLYQPNRKPIFNASLKARIDAFLVSHSEQVKNVPRTIGTKPVAKPESVIFQNPIKSIEFKPGMTFEQQVQFALTTIRSSGSKSTSESKNVCQKCDANEFLYQINACKHLICRKCLLGNKESRMKCNPCLKFFSRSDVQRFHNFLRQNKV